jgi:hypothetical protein
MTANWTTFGYNTTTDSYTAPYPTQTVMPGTVTLSTNTWSPTPILSRVDIVDGLAGEKYVYGYGADGAVLFTVPIEVAQQLLRLLALEVFV